MDTTENHLLNRTRYVGEYASWLNTMKGDWDIFAMTAVFRIQQRDNTRARFEQEYRRVVRKLEKRLCRHACNKRYGTGDLLLDLPHKSRSLQAQCNDKLRSKLKRVTEKESKAITFNDLFYFEREEKSIKSKHIHQFVPHVHGVIAVPKTLTHKVWDDSSSTLLPRMQHDYDTMAIVESVLMERMRTDNVGGWLNYMTKQKLLYYY